jgi:5-methylcytosine-specific restriction protein A
MPALFFEDDDEGYARFVAEHPSGYVGNMTSTRRPTYFVIHAATCTSITPGSSRSNGPGAFTGHDYRKVTADRREEIVQWASENGFVELRYCRRCVPGLNAAFELTSLYPDEVAEGAYLEGATRQVLVNAYERSDAARAACLAAHGVRCCVCDFDFGEGFGELGAGFIHVHHLNELSLVREEHRVDPVQDLRPICPNCHAMAHRTRPAMSIEELKVLRQRDPEEGKTNARS